MTDFATVKGFLQELQLAIVAEDPAEGIVVVEDEERGIKHLVVDCEDPMLIFTERILEVPTCPGALFRRLLQIAYYTRNVKSYSLETAYAAMEYGCNSHIDDRHVIYVGLKQ